MIGLITGLITGRTFTFTGTGTGCLLGFGKTLIFFSSVVFVVLIAVGLLDAGGMLSCNPGINVFVKEIFSNGFPSPKE